MDVSAKRAKLWINKRERRDGGSWKEYNTSVNKKDMNGRWSSLYFKVKFSKQIMVPDDIPNGTTMDYRGFMSLEEYKDTKKPLIIITEVRFEDYEPTPQTNEAYGVDDFSSAEDDIPF